MRVLCAQVHVCHLLHCMQTCLGLISAFHTSERDDELLISVTFSSTEVCVLLYVGERGGG